MSDIERREAERTMAALGGDLYVECSCGHDHETTTHSGAVSTVVTCHCAEHNVVVYNYDRKRFSHAGWRVEPMRPHDEWPPSSWTFLETA